MANAPTELRTGTLFSSDSHVMESPEVWADHLPASFWPDGGGSFQGQPGGHDPEARLEEMGQDGVTAEVLYPTLGLKLFGMDDAPSQEGAMRAFNDWLINYCRVDTTRLLGIGTLPCYDIDKAVAELEHCHAGGLGGGLVWQAPHPDLPFGSRHYDPLWKRAEDLSMPISLHILTGHNYSKDLGRKGREAYRGSVNLKLATVLDSLFEFVFSGALDRFPDLKIVLVENEIGWLPFVLQQWDYYYHRFKKANPPEMEHQPSHYFDRQIFATFFRDPMMAHLFDWWGADNCMWSNDYPHPNSTWPNSRDVIANNLAYLPQEIYDKIVRTTCEKLYGVTIPTSV